MPLPIATSPLRILAASVAAIAFAPSLPARQTNPEGSDSFVTTVRPWLDEYCSSCHSADRHKGDVDLERFETRSSVIKEPKLWQLVSEKLRNGEMPPSDKTQPTPHERSAIVAWIEGTLDEISKQTAGDPGPVVLRRLSNAEYTFTVRDLTGISSLDPAREFPVDGAAGEGFTNVGNALVMSPPLLTKYLDAAKGIANHAMLLEDGIRFSVGATRRDQTEDLLAAIRGFYRQYTDPGGGEVVNLQGIVFLTNEGGRLPLEKYLGAAIDLRDRANSKEASDVESVARSKGLSPKYLNKLYAALTGKEPFLLLDPIRSAFKSCSKADIPVLTGEIAAWQKSLWKFSTIGHIGKAGGPRAWMEPLDPLSTTQELKVALPPDASRETRTIYLVAGDAGDGNEHDAVVWQSPRFVKKGRPDLFLRDVRAVTQERQAKRSRLFRCAEAALLAAAESDDAIDLDAVAQRHGVESSDLLTWLSYLGLGPTDPAPIESCFATKLARPSNYDFISGWGSADTPLAIANASDQAVRIPGNMKPHGIAVHPSPSLRAVVAFRSPIAARMRVDAKIQHAHPECGNGVEWALELRRGTQRRLLAKGFAQGGAVEQPSIGEPVRLRAGDVVAVSIGARDGNHSCDLTAVDLTLVSVDDAKQTFDLSADCSKDFTVANPHADGLGHDGVWSFSTEPDGEPRLAAEIPEGSILARWLTSPSAEEKARLAAEFGAWLAKGGEAKSGSPDALLYRDLASLGGPLLAAEPAKPLPHPSSDTGEFGIDPARFGVDLEKNAIDPRNFVTHAPAVEAIEVPSELVEGCEFVTTGALEPGVGENGSVQLEVRLDAPPAALGPKGLVPAETRVSNANGVWTSNNQRIQFAVPVVVNAGSPAEKRILAAFDEFRELFPAALCYAKIVPVDEAVTLTQFYREDAALSRLMLDENEARQLDRLWSDFHFVAQDALSQVDAFDQIYQFATQDADPKVFEPLREPIRRAAALFKEKQAAAEGRHIDAVLEFADRAWRRPLEPSEKDGLRALYPRLREDGLSHDEAIRLLLARVLTAPAYLYHRELPAAGREAAPVSDFELASRLSYFLWSSMPDDELRAVAAAGRLHRDEEIVRETRRMLLDPKVRRLATEFGCAWLHISSFDQNTEKSERHFPTFRALAADMYEEPIRFFTALFQTNARVSDLLDADYTYLDAALAAHYGIPGVEGAEWRRVDGVKAYSRGGILGFAATLSAQSGASRTSPILRGNFVCEAILDDKLPRPPKDVPKLPEDEGTESRTIRDLVERHSKDPSCAKCHQRMDAFGFALESFDAIGRLREQDLGGRPIDTHAKTMDGSEFDGIAGLRNYLLEKRGDAFHAQLCKKLLGYALGRAVQLSDRPLLSSMTARLASNEARMNDIVEAIVLSPQFRSIRGRDATCDEVEKR